MVNLKQKTQDILDLADIKIDGNNSWDIHVKNPRFYSRVLSGGSLALGESYIDGWWDCRALDEFFYKVLESKLNEKIKGIKYILPSFIKAKIINLQKKSRAYEVGKKHYDLGNILYKKMLDKYMNYSCGYWKYAKNLDEAEIAKLDLICKKVGLKPGMKVLDVGCGWGGFAKYAAEKYKVDVVGITISKEQAKLARKLCKGLPVEIKLEDYRNLPKNNEKFDAIISIGMFEHVGVKNYKIFMKVIYKLLKNEGLFLLHTIGGNESVNLTDPWIGKYIFTNSMLPSIKQIAEASENILILEDWHNFGTDYDRTLMAWHKNFNKNWNKIKKSNNYDERFYRMWNYYLLSCAGSFRARKNQLWQIVFSKNGIKKGYKSIR